MILVQGAEGLVHEQQRRRGHERAGERDALLHAARELMRVVAAEGVQSHELDEALGAGLGFGRAGVDLQGQAYVIDDGAPGQQGCVLEDEADLLLALGLAWRPAVDQGAPVGRRLQAADEAEQRRFAAAARPDDGDELAAVERPDRSRKAPVVVPATHHKRR